MFHRVTGLALVVYLGLHLALLSLLRSGPQGWDAFVQLAGSPLFLALDAMLFAAITFHAFNGLRLTLLGMGWGIHRQRQLLWACAALAAACTAGVAIAMFLAPGSG
jgi:succinate dehydrogenase / fumarate reductase cytochrome b subunit